MPLIFVVKFLILLEQAYLYKIEDFVTKMKIRAHMEPKGAHRVDDPNLKTTLDVGLRVRFGP